MGQSDPCNIALSLFAQEEASWRRWARRIMPCLVNKPAHRQGSTSETRKGAGLALPSAARASGPPSPRSSWPGVLSRSRCSGLFRTSRYETQPRDRKMAGRAVAAEFAKTLVINRWTAGTARALCCDVSGAQPPDQAPVAQWIVHRSPKPVMWVRSPPGAPDFGSAMGTRAPRKEVPFCPSNSGWWHSAGSGVVPASTPAVKSGAVSGKFQLGR